MGNQNYVSDESIHIYNSYLKKQKGITLIALVITIIVLLILAGVSLNVIVGDNGILEKAKASDIASDVAKAKELIQLELMGRTNEYGFYTNEDVIYAVKQVTDNDVEENAEETTTKNGNLFSIADLWVSNSDVDIPLPEIPDDIPFEPVESEEGDTIFDISKGNITISKTEGYEGTNSNGIISKGPHKPEENTYYITQSDPNMIKEANITELDGNPIHIADLFISNAGRETPTLPKNPTPSEEPGPNDIVFDISKGSITIGASYNGKNSSGETVSGTHQSKNRYWITQKDPTKETTNTITFNQNSTDLYNVVLENVNMITRNDHICNIRNGQIIIEGERICKKCLYTIKGRKYC